MRAGIASNVAEILGVYGSVSDVHVRANVSSLNKSIALTRTKVKRDYAAGTGVPVGKVSKRLKIRKANFRKQVSSLFVGTMPFAVVDLGARQLKSGVVSYPTEAGRVKNPRAFFATMRNGHRGVFERKRHTRLPIKEIKLYPYEAAERAVNQNIHVAGENFPRLYNADFNRRLNKKIERRVTGEAKAIIPGRSLGSRLRSLASGGF